jgi:hypothetical protein
MAKLLSGWVFAIACASWLACGGSTFSGWTLDELTPAQGFSLRTPTLLVPSGHEIQYCYFVDVPDLGAGSDILVGEVVTAINPGSHHVNVFRVKTLVNLRPELGEAFQEGATRGTVVKDGECFKSANWADWPLVANSQKSLVNDPITRWKLPANVAHRFRPGEKLMLQIHYVNATTQTTPFQGKVGVNFVRSTDAAPVELGTLFATQQSIRVCQSNPRPTYKGTCAFPPGTQVRVVAANGHFHSRGKRFRIFAWDGLTSTAPPDAARFYESIAWDEPPMATNLDVQLPMGGGIQWTCEFQWQRPSVGCDAVNAKDRQQANDCCYTFGPEVETNEHCNAFVYYWPKAEGNVFCN